MDWMKLGYSYHKTTQGRAYKTRLSAMRSRHADEGVVIACDDGFEVRTGTAMTELSAQEFIDKYLPYKKLNQVYAEGVYESHRKPWPIEQPDLCGKYMQALETLGLCWWQQPYEQLVQRPSYHNLPLLTWQKARHKRGLSVAM